MVICLYTVVPKLLSDQEWVQFSSIHRYSSGGEYLAKAILFTPNDESGITEVRLTTTVRIRCAFPRLEATGGTIARSAAVQKKRNEALIFHVLVIQDCSDQPVVTQWSLFLVDQDETVPEQEQMILVDTDRNQMSELEVKIQPYTLVYGLYVLNVTVNNLYQSSQSMSQRFSMFLTHGPLGKFCLGSRTKAVERKNFNLACKISFLNDLFY